VEPRKHRGAPAGPVKYVSVSQGSGTSGALVRPGGGPWASGVRLVSRWSGSAYVGREARLRRSDLAPLVDVIVTGGIVGPVLMLVGLGRVSGAVGSPLLSLEAPFTIALAVVFFREHLGTHRSPRGSCYRCCCGHAEFPGGEVHADCLVTLA
jgi:drug/metabolite transporter (DMT)-like permease